jgi:DNA replication protein DnaC
LDIAIKAGFSDPAAARRLRALLQSDFLAIDELAKEHARSEFLVSELEEILKTRYCDKYPTLLASNMSFDVLCQMYGPTIASLLDGRCQRVELDGGDFRQKAKGIMRLNMGYRT